MRTALVITCFVALGFGTAAGAASNSGETQKKEEKKGITVDDLGRGLKSAGQNIEKEIPKIGPAIGETVKNSPAKISRQIRNPRSRINRPVIRGVLTFAARLSPHLHMLPPLMLRHMLRVAGDSWR